MGPGVALLGGAMGQAHRLGEIRRDAAPVEVANGKLEQGVRVGARRRRSEASPRCGRRAPDRGRGEAPAATPGREGRGTRPATWDESGRHRPRGKGKGATRRGRRPPPTKPPRGRPESGSWKPGQQAWNGRGPAGRRAGARTAAFVHGAPGVRREGAKRRTSRYWKNATWAFHRMRAHPSARVRCSGVRRDPARSRSATAPAIP